MDKNVIVGRSYRDRRGLIWKIESVSGSPLYPVTAGHWDGIRSRARCFQRNGQYEKHGDTLMDLVELVRGSP